MMRWLLGCIRLLTSWTERRPHTLSDDKLHVCVVLSGWTQVSGRIVSNGCEVVATALAL